MRLRLPVKHQRSADRFGVNDRNLSIQRNLEKPLRRTLVLHNTRADVPELIRLAANLAGRGDHDEVISVETG